ncbi:galactose-1-phosphate uridylyltransferase [Actinomarinicola tropica]|uniref:galactose-1-phosphate uridylyltransferase n=1 Tax=Actinomarinicola tropica TaxID=2789776 RepID=UPI001E37E681|nr:DUF4921 family protein [Actinomarinicola tropica]
MTGPSNELRRNPLTGRWVTIASGRAIRPQDFATRTLAVEAERTGPCPFCPGNEELTPPALATYEGSTGGWLVRVVPNRYPAFDGDGTMRPAVDGVLHQAVHAAGRHEVLVIGPEHEGDLALLDDERIDVVATAIRERLVAHAALPQVAYTQAIVNFGREAGASLEHPHAQLLGIPFVPLEIDDELVGFRRFASARHDPAVCLLCTTLSVELAADQRVVEADDDAVAVAPYWSGAPYEMLVVPRVHDPRLHTAPVASLRGVGRLLRTAIHRLHRVLGDVAYNVVIHTAPHHHDVHYHWHIHLLPRTSTLAGFEQGTGVLINTMSPEDATVQLTDAARVGGPPPSGRRTGVAG